MMLLSQVSHLGFDRRQSGGLSGPEVSRLLDSL